jgi:putative transposase
VFLHAYEGPRPAKQGIGSYFVFFNEEPPHQALGYRTPMEVYRESIGSKRKAG